MLITFSPGGEIFASARGDGLLDRLHVWTVESARWGRTFAHCDQHRPFPTGNRQVHHILHPALAHGILPLRLESRLLQGDKQPISTGSKEVIDLLRGYEAVPRRLNERDPPPAQAGDGPFPADQRAQLELIVEVVGAGVVGLLGQKVPAAGQFVPPDRGVPVDSPALFAEGTGKIEGQHGGLGRAGRGMPHGDAVPPPVAGNLKVPPVVHHGNQDAVFRVEHRRY